MIIAAEFRTKPCIDCGFGLTEAECSNLFVERMPGAASDRPALRDALEFA